MEFRAAIDDARERASRVVTARALALRRREESITVEALTTQGSTIDESQ